MKTFFMLKLPVLLCSFFAALILSPACKAQSEVNPDHYDDGGSTEPFERPSIIAVPDATKASQKPVVAQARARATNPSKTNPNLTKQLVAVHDVKAPAEQNAVAIQDKRKTATRKSNKQ